MFSYKKMRVGFQFYWKHLVVKYILVLKIIEVHWTKWKRKILRSESNQHCIRLDTINIIKHRVESYF